MKKRYRGKPIIKYAFVVNRKYGFCASIGVDSDSGENVFPIIKQNSKIEISLKEENNHYPLPLISVSSPSSSSLENYNHPEHDSRSSSDEWLSDFPPIGNFIFEFPFILGSSFTCEQEVRC
jgi:hypothetical protein